MKRIAIILFTLSILCILVSAQNRVEELDAKLTEIAKRGNLPGFGVAIVSKNKVLYQNGYGFANIANKKPYTKDTIQNIGSISKTFIGIALMKAVEQGKLNLNEDINKILPFKIVNPHYPKSKITIRHLATHTSTIVDTDNYERAYIFDKKFDIKGIPQSYAEAMELYNSNKKMSLEDFVKKLLTEKGEWYSKDNFLKTTPGAKFNYSNVGSAIAAYVLELKTGETFDNYTRKHILKPLKLENSGWTMESVDMNKHATGYVLDMKPLPNYSLITFADGGFRSSVSDLSKYLMEVIKGVNGEGKVLSKESYTEMISKQSKLIDTDYSIFWGHRKNGLIGHTGGDPGATTIMIYNPQTMKGVILFTNYLIDDQKQQKQFVDAYKTLVEYSDKL